MKIEDEIKQRKRFRNEFVKLDVNIMFTASWLGGLKTEILKPYKISWQQFNILRILKGSHPKPASIKTLTERMIDRTSNTSRLVDKLTKKGLVSRTVNESDRRRMDVNITPKGLDLLDACSKELEAAISKNLSSLTENEALTLNELLNKIRS